MNPVKIKICGITRETDLRAAISAGVDAIGFVVGVPSSPRNLTIDRAEKLIRETPLFVNSVVVTVLNDINLAFEICRALQPCTFQIHGGSSSQAYALRKKLQGVSMIRTLEANSRTVSNDAMEASKLFDAVLLDSSIGEKWGGTGVVHDWELSRDIRRAIHPRPFILAGGLTPSNIEEAVRLVQPYAVDVSSGVELSPGVKDPEKISEFVEKARSVSP